MVKSLSGIVAWWATVGTAEVFVNIPPDLIGSDTTMTMNNIECCWVIVNVRSTSGCHKWWWWWWAIGSSNRKTHWRWRWVEEKEIWHVYKWKYGYLGKGTSIKLHSIAHKSNFLCAIRLAIRICITWSYLNENPCATLCAMNEMRMIEFTSKYIFPTWLLSFLLNWTDSIDFKYMDDQIE